MSENKFVERCLSIINSTKNTHNLSEDWEYSSYEIDFKINQENYRFTFCRRLFGFFSYIKLENRTTLTSKYEDLTKSDFKLLKKSFFDRIEYLEDQMVKNVFPDLERDNKINTILDGDN